MLSVCSARFPPAAFHPPRSCRCSTCPPKLLTPSRPPGPGRAAAPESSPTHSRATIHRNVICEPDTVAEPYRSSPRPPQTVPTHVSPASFSPLCPLLLQPCLFPSLSRTRSRVLVKSAKTPRGKEGGGGIQTNNFSPANAFWSPEVGSPPWRSPLGAAAQLGSPTMFPTSSPYASRSTSPVNRMARPSPGPPTCDSAYGAL